MHTSPNVKVLSIILAVIVVGSALLTFLISSTRTYKESQILLSAFGFLINVYVTLYQYRKVPIVCPRTELIDCAKVLDSKYSFLFGQRFSVIALPFFIAELILVYIGALLILLIYNILGLLFVAERIIVQSNTGRLCIYCTAEYIIIITLFLISLITVI